MPTSTFFHLPEEKQKRLLDAAKVEFSRTSLKEASIANIVKLAEIPRGSFYQYFENKEDLYFYYFATLRKDRERDIERHIVAAKGDLLEGLDVYFSKMVIEVLTGENVSFYRNLFMNMDYRSSNRVTNNLASSEDEQDKASHCRNRKEHDEHKEYAERLYKIIDFSKIDINNEQEFVWLMQIIMHVVFSTIADGYRQLNRDSAYDIQKTVQQLRMKLKWLRNGAYK